MYWIYITADPGIAAFALKHGVQEIMVDLETIGKQERQGHLTTHKAFHKLEDIGRVRHRIGDGSLLVRVNPLGPHTESEVAAAVELGASRLMLPMFKGSDDVATFSAIVGARLPVTWLVETPSALNSLPRFAGLLGAGDRIHFGLNDLSIALDLPIVFAPVARGLLDAACATCIARNVTFGIGGIGRIGQGAISPALVLSQHVRLGSTQAILSSAFRGNSGSLEELRAEFDMQAEISKLEDAYASAKCLSKDELALQTLAFQAKVAEWD